MVRYSFWYNDLEGYELERSSHKGLVPNNKMKEMPMSSHMLTGPD